MMQNRTIEFLLLFFSLFLNLVQSFINTDVDCGLSKVHHQQREPRIVNGEEALEGEFPWMVSLIGLRGEHLCGGILMHTSWVLTAAHCMNKEPTQIKVSAAWQRGTDRSRQTQREQLLRVNRIIVHPSYDSSRSRTADDIALINLIGGVNWSDFILPACLPDIDNQSYTGTIGTVTGWGITQNGGRHANILQKVNVPIMENEKCRQWLQNSRKLLDVISEKSICAGYEEGGKDSCNGDSGGPLMVKQDDRLIVVGVVSGGIGCALPRLPGFYTRVNKYVGWILETIRNYDETFRS